MLTKQGWFTIPFVLATTYGLAAAATEHLPAFPTYPNRMNAYEISSGMAMPYAALAIMGKGGVVAVLIMVFMAVTSATSSETVATSALVSYNIYQAYINPKASGKQLKKVSEYTAVVFAVIVAAIAAGFNHAGFSVGFLTTAIGIFVDSAIVPMACTIMWKKQSKAAVLISPLASSAAGLIAWFVKAHVEYGSISITTLSGNLPLVAGNMMALCGPVVLTPLITYLKPEDFDWSLFKSEIKKGDDDQEVTEEHVSSDEMESSWTMAESHSNKENRVLLKARKRSIVASIILTLILLILWPIPMYGTGYVFSKGFFVGWMVVVFLWAFFAALVITLLPIWEGRKSIALLARHMFSGKNGATASGEVLEGVVVRQRDESVKETKVSYEKSPDI